MVEQIETNEGEEWIEKSRSVAENYQKDADYYKEKLRVYDECQTKLKAVGLSKV